MSEHAKAGKKSAAIKAATFVEDGMTLGIGTGSTAAYFIDELAKKIEQGLRLKGVPTSKATESLALAAGVEIIEPGAGTIIDLAVDGADEVDAQLNLIKGGGGALLREKIVAYAAKKFIVIADASKRVETLGAFPLPVEIEAFSHALTIDQIRATVAGLELPTQRIDLRKSDGGLYLTDGGNLIADCALGSIENPARLETRLREIPGVIECGLFCGMTDLAIFGDGAETEVVTV